MIIDILPEGLMEIHIAKKILPFCGHEAGEVHKAKGCDYIRQKVAGFSRSVKESIGLLVLTDFRDSGAPCISEALQKYILWRNPNPHKNFLCRFAVNEIESWLLADREGLAKFLFIDISLMPQKPEKEKFPKRTLINLSQKSRCKKIREGIAPSPENRSNVGEKYEDLMSEFIAKFWNIETAMRNAPSLERCVRRLRELPS